MVWSNPTTKCSIVQSIIKYKVKSNHEMYSDFNTNKFGHNYNDSVEVNP